MDTRAWDERYRSADLVWGTAPNRFVKEYCEHLAPGVAVDVACGEGRNSIWLAQRGWQVTGLDFSAVAIERAVALSAKLPDEVGARLTWRVADARTHEMESGSVDLAVVAYLQIPPAELTEALTHSAVSLRRGGTLFIVGHDRRNLTEGVSGPQDITRLYDADTLRHQLESNGLHVDTATTVERPTDEGIALDTVVRATRS